MKLNQSGVPGSKKPPRYTVGQIGDKSEHKKKHCLKCIFYFIPMSRLARSVLGGDTDRCVIGTFGTMLPTATKPACPGKIYQFNPA